MYEEEPRRLRREDFSDSDSYLIYLHQSGLLGDPDDPEQLQSLVRNASTNDYVRSIVASVGTMEDG